jgi:serine/threonine protein kinase
MEKATITTSSGNFRFLETLYLSIEEDKHIELIELLPSKTKAISKIYRVVNEEVYIKAQKEVEILSSINHKNAIKYLRNFQYIHPKDGISYFAIVLEYCDGGNLEGALQKMKNTKKSFPVRMLLDQFFGLVDVLAYLQSRNIMHRDINPQNIFVVKEKELKIADFNLGKNNNLDYLHTFQGTRDYLSPILFEKLCKIMRYGIEKRIKHNVFKSDVYSLGLVFLYMVNLCKPDKIEKNRPQKMLTNANNIKNVYVKKIVEKMLAIDEDNRPDFIELESFITNIKNMTLCAFCLNIMTQPECLCKKCFYGFHNDCIKNKKECLTCKNSLICPKCTENFIFTYENCTHEMCINCHDNEICEKKFDLIINLENPQSDPTLIDHCVQCLSQLYYIDKIPYCNVCETFLCPNCRFPHDQDFPCLFANVYCDIYCKCRNRIEYIKCSLFLNCAQCGSICRVCMKPLIESSHLKCSQKILLR